MTDETISVPLSRANDATPLVGGRFEMLAGRTPFRSPDRVTLMRMQVSAPIPSLASVAPGRAWWTPQLEDLVRRSLAKQREQRFSDAAEMVAALDAAFLSLDPWPGDL